MATDSKPTSSSTIEWKGYYVQNRQQHEMTGLQHWENGVITGEGKDNIGNFSWSGTYNEHSARVVKQYAGAHAVLYEGTRHGTVFEGSWSLGSSKDLFRFTCEEQVKNEVAQGLKPPAAQPPATDPNPTSTPAPNFTCYDEYTAVTVVKLVNFESNRYLFCPGAVFKGSRGDEGGWLASKPIVGADANYYNRALWEVHHFGDGSISLINQESRRYLFDTSDNIKSKRGNDGGWLSAKPVVGTDANYYNRALWEVEKNGNGTVFLVNKETRRYLFDTGEKFTGNRGAERGWLGSKPVVGTDDNYYNKAMWTVEGGALVAGDFHLGKEPFFLFSELGNNLVLDVEGGATEQAYLISFPFHGGKNQQFTYENGVIKSVKSGLVLDVATGVGEGHKIIQHPFHGGPNQQFEIRSDGAVVVKGTQIVLTVQDGKTDAETHVIAKTDTGAAHQRWRAKPISVIAGGAFQSHKTPEFFVLTEEPVLIQSALGDAYVNTLYCGHDNGSPIGLAALQPVNPVFRWYIKRSPQGLYFIVSSTDTSVTRVLHQHSGTDYITLWEGVNEGNTQVALEDAGDGYYYISFPNGSGKSVALERDSTDNGTRLVQKDKQNTNAFKWRFLRAGDLITGAIPELVYINKTFTEYPSQTWAEAREFAKSHGGRLPTNEEVNRWLNGKAFAGRKGEDTWVPTFSDSNFSDRDWVEIGDGRYGKSHIQAHGEYPNWGDTHDPQHYKGPILIKLGLEPPSEFKYINSIPNQSWPDARAYARAQGGRLPTNEEVVNFLKGKTFYDRKGKDTWIPTFVDGTLKLSDWVQIGDDRVGTSHRTKFGYPPWGDARNSQSFRGPILIRMVPDDYETETPDFFVGSQEPLLIQSALGNVYAHLLDGDHANGNPIALWTYQPTNPNFRWYIKKNPQGQYFLVSAADTSVNRVLHQHGGTDITLWEGVGQGNTQVSLEDAGNGYYYIGFPKGSGKYVTVPDGSISNGTRLIQKEKKDTNAFKWRFVRNESNEIRVSLKSWKGDCLHRPDSPDGVTTWNTGIGNEWSLIFTYPNHVELRSWKGDFLHRPDSDQGVTNCGPGVNGNKWTIERTNDGFISFKSWKGDYLHRPDSDHGVTSWNTGIGNKWTIISLDANKVLKYDLGSFSIYNPRQGLKYVVTNNSKQTWFEASALAKSQGGRLPTNEEVQYWLNGTGYYEKYEKDTWVPTYYDSSFSVRDWVQIGDNRFGQSHVDKYGYPAWGDSQESQSYKGTVLIKFAPEPKPDYLYIYFTSNEHQTWSGARALAKSHGGRLVTSDEAKRWLNGKAFVERHGRDTWIQTFHDDTFRMRDMAQIGDDRFGKSHLDIFGDYPTWGDNHSQPYKGPVLIKLENEPEPPYQSPDYFIQTSEPVLIQNALGDAYVHLLGGGHDNGNPIALAILQPTNPIFKWYIKKSPQGLYFIVSSTDTSVTRVLHQHGGTDNITLWEGVDQGNTQVALENSGDGYYYISFPNGSGKYVTLERDSTDNGTRLVQKDKQNTKAFKWRFIRACNLDTGKLDVPHSTLPLVKLINYESNRYLFCPGAVFTGKRGDEGGWLASKPILGTDANYYNRASWEVQRNGDGTITLINSVSQRYLFDTSDQLKGNRGDDGGWLSSKPVVGTDANYYNRALWEVEKNSNGTVFLVNKETRRYLFDTGNKVQGNRGAEGGWLASKSVVGVDANYYNRAMWTVEGEDLIPVHLGKEPFFLFSELGHKLVLDVEGGVTGQANLISFPFHGGKNQQFTYENGFIKSVNSGLVLDVATEVGEGHQIIQHPSHGGPNQQFEIRSDGAIAAKGTNIVLTVQGGKTDANTHVIASTFVPGTVHQLWKLKPVSEGLRESAHTTQDIPEVVKVEESVTQPRPVEGRPDQSVHEEVRLEHLSNNTVVRTVTTITTTTKKETDNKGNVTTTTITTKTVTVTTTRVVSVY